MSDYEFLFAASVTVADQAAPRARLAPAREGGLAQARRHRGLLHLFERADRHRVEVVGKAPAALRRKCRIVVVIAA
jgi:hypothetical protein